MKEESRKPVVDIVLKDCSGVREFLQSQGIDGVCGAGVNFIILNDSDMVYTATVREFTEKNQIHIQSQSWDKVLALSDLLENLCATVSTADMKVFNR
jgi:hypothetical protein